MASESLAVYLNDHLAGSAGALELLERLQAVKTLEEWAGRVRADVEADRHVLEELMRTAGIAQSRTRQAAGWLTEKLAALKTSLDDRSGGALQHLELIEALALGIDGKRALWIALQAASEHVPALRELDYLRLIERAEQQRRVVEGRRLEAAIAALRPQ